MSEPHKLIEKEFTWDEFHDLLKQENQIIRIIETYPNGRSFSRDYDWGQKQVKFDDVKVTFHNGCYTDYKFAKEFNEKILYGFGSFYLYSQIFDREETGEEEEYDGNDGCYYTRPITRKLETYTLQEREVKIYTVKKFS